MELNELFITVAFVAFAIAAILISNDDNDSDGDNFSNNTLT